jgi:hypothetical protein
VSEWWYKSSRIALLLCNPMFVLFYNGSTSEIIAVFEFRALPSADGMRMRVLEEVDRTMAVCWRRTHVCTMFVCQFLDSRIYVNSVVEGIWEARRRRKAFLRVYLEMKSPIELMADERRLALGMSFHSRLGNGSRLQGIDAHVLETIMWFAGPCLV